jgi:hypothetical protein
LTVFYVTTYVVKLEKLGEVPAIIKKYVAWMKSRPDLFKEMKSWKSFSHMYGGNRGCIVDMMEFESLADLEKFSIRYHGDKEHITKIAPEIQAMIVPGTYSSSIWKANELQ